jgi:hypothetical protein
MNAAHLHLVVIHAAVVAPAFALALLALAALRREAGVHRAAVLVLGLGALGATAASLSGEGAEERVEGLVADERAIEEHEEIAEAATVTSWVALAVGVAGLAFGARRPGLAIGATAAAAGLAMAAMGATGLAGGKIRHAEELGDGAMAASTRTGAAAYVTASGEDDDEGNASRK